MTGYSFNDCRTDRISLWTSNSPNSWLGVDLGENTAVTPTHYIIRYSSSGEACCIRNWELQGTNDIAALENPNAVGMSTLKSWLNP